MSITPTTPQPWQPPPTAPPTPPTDGGGGGPTPEPITKPPDKGIPVVPGVWVVLHYIPTYGPDGAITGYVPDPADLAEIQAIRDRYAALQKLYTPTAV